MEHYKKSSERVLVIGPAAAHIYMVCCVQQRECYKILSDCAMKYIKKIYKYFYFYVQNSLVKTDNNKKYF